MKKTLMVLGLMTSMAVTAPTFAQGTQKQSGQTQGQKSQQSDNPNMKGRRAVFGEVVGTRDIQLKGINSKHRLVKIKNKEGNTVVVNVGDSTRTPNGRLKKGANVLAIGKEARINGKPVLYAKYIGDMQPAGFWGKPIVVPGQTKDQPLNKGQSQK